MSDDRDKFPIPKYEGNIDDYIVDWIAVIVITPIFFLGLIFTGEIFDIKWRNKK